MDYYSKALEFGDSNLAYALRGRGQTALALGRRAEASAVLARAQQVLERSQSEPLLLANVLFAQAQVLAEDPDGRVRASELSISAKSPALPLGSSGSALAQEIDRGEAGLK